MEEIRRDHRSPRLLRGALESASGKRHDLLIKNISRHGLGAKFSGHEVKQGEHVVVDLPKIGRLTGTVQWVRGGGIGLKITEEIDPSLLLFENNTLAPPKPGPYRVADRFQPVTSTYRPGFRRK